jgi:FG-GAP-like repeat
VVLHASRNDVFSGTRQRAVRARRPWLGVIVWLFMLAVATPTLVLAQAGEPADADAQAYTIKRLAKNEVRYRKLADGWVWVAPYFQYRLEREDERYLYVREYATPPAATPAPPSGAPRSEPTAPPPLSEVDRVVLAPFSSGLPTAGQWRNQFALADVNGDGHADLVHGPPRKGGGGPHIWLGDGAGHWRSWSDAVYPPAAYDYGAAAVADFDGDGHADLALAAHLKGITVLLGDGEGRFRIASTPLDFEPDRRRAFTTRAIVARDWNRDGRPDLIALGEGPSRGGGGSLGWVVYLNEDGLRWRRQAQAAPAPRTFGDALAVADVDGDGWDDLLTASHALGNRHVLHYGGPRERTVSLDALPAQAMISSVAAADFDGDRHPDLAFGSLSHDDSGTWHASIDVLLARPGDAWRRVVVHSQATRAIPRAIAAGDVDGDGRVDLAAVDDEGTLRLFLGDGGGGFASERSPEVAPLGSACRGYAVRLADLNGDGRDEIVAAFASDASTRSDEPGCAGGGRLQAWTPAPRR